MNLFENLQMMNESDKELKPYDGDNKNFLMFYLYNGFSRKEIEEYALSHGFNNIYWGSDEAPYYDFKEFYNGDTLVVFNNAEDLPDGYREDAERYGEPILKTESVKETNESIENKPLKVCDWCLAGIESTQGRQYATKMNPEHYEADEEDDETGESLYKCDWCDDLFIAYDLNEL